MIVISWTEPESGRRVVSTFPDAAGTGRLTRRLKRRRIPFSVGWARDAGVALGARQTRQSWRPDPRVWASFRRPPGGDAA